MRARVIATMGAGGARPDTACSLPSPTNLGNTTRGMARLTSPNNANLRPDAYTGGSANCGTVFKALERIRDPA